MYNILTTKNTSEKTYHFLKQKKVVTNSFKKHFFKIILCYDIILITQISDEKK